MHGPLRVKRGSLILKHIFGDQLCLLLNVHQFHISLYVNIQTENTPTQRTKIIVFMAQTRHNLTLKVSNSVFHGYT